MDTLAAIESRRSIRHFDPNFTIPEEDVTKIFEETILSPTGFNLQHWRFVLVTDPDLRAKIRDVSWYQEQIIDASLLVVICADIEAWHKHPSRYWHNAPKEVQQHLIPTIREYYEGKDQVQRDECMRSCGMAAQTMMLAAKSLGYDSCPMDGFDFKKVAELIELPSDHLISMFVTIGKAKSPAHERAGQLSLKEVLKNNHF